LDVASIILSCQISNMTGTTQYVSVYIEKIDDIGNPFTLLKDAPIPPNEALIPFSGKIVLEKNDKLIFNTPNTVKLEAVIYVLENDIK